MSSSEIKTICVDSILCLIEIQGSIDKRISLRDCGLSEVQSLLDHVFVHTEVVRVSDVIVIQSCPVLDNNLRTGLQFLTSLEMDSLWVRVSFKIRKSNDINIANMINNKYINK